MSRMKPAVSSLLLMFCLLLNGCALYPVHDPGYGPPPHAPAHGYRHKYHGYDLVYDSGLGVYVVIGYPEYYYLDNYFYRYDSGAWFYSSRIDRGWQPHRQRSLPPGLAKKHPGRGRGR